MRLVIGFLAGLACAWWPRGTTRDASNYKELRWSFGATQFHIDANVNPLRLVRVQILRSV